MGGGVTGTLAVAYSEVLAVTKNPASVDKCKPLSLRGTNVSRRA